MVIGCDRCVGACDELSNERLVRVARHTHGTVVYIASHGRFDTEDGLLGHPRTVLVVVAWQ
jgi:hypothetical protein